MKINQMLIHMVLSPETIQTSAIAASSGTIEHILHIRREMLLHMAVEVVLSLRRVGAFGIEAGVAG